MYRSGDLLNKPDMWKTPIISFKPCLSCCCLAAHKIVVSDTIPVGRRAGADLPPSPCALPEERPWFVR